MQNATAVPETVIEAAAEPAEAPDTLPVVPDVSLEYSAVDDVEVEYAAESDDGDECDATPTGSSVCQYGRGHRVPKPPVRFSPRL